MSDNNETIVLSGPSVFYPQNRMDAYRVESGTILIYIVPLEHGKPGRRILLCEAEKGRVIPSFVYKDRDYKDWRFAIVAKGEDASLSILSNKVTSALHKNFLRRLDIHTYDQEGFDGSLTEYYKCEDVKDKAYIKKSQHAVPEVTAATFGVVKAAFEHHSQFDASQNHIYCALHFLCSQMGVPIGSEDEVLLRTGKDPSVPEMASAAHLISRKIILEGDWYKNDCGPFIGFIDKAVVACIPKGQGKYYVFHSENSQIEQLSVQEAKTIHPQVYAIGRTLPAKSLTKKEVIQFCLHGLKTSDYIPAIILALATALIGILLPTLNQMIYDDYIPLGDVGNLAQLCAVMLSFMVGNLSFSIVKNLFDFRATSRIANELQNAAYHRLFHLPESFFRKFDSADLANRILSVGNVATSYANALLITSISAIFSIVYLIRMWSYTGRLTLIAIGMYAIYTILVAVITALARKGEVKIAEADAEASSRLYQYLNGVDKIRMAGVEDYALLAYMRPYAKQQSEEIKVNRIVSIKEALAGVITSLFSMVLYLVITKSNIDLSVGKFVAFNTAFGMFCSTIQSFVDELLNLFQGKEQVNRFWPIFSTRPEDDYTKEVPGSLSGAVSVEHVKFAYESGGKNVLNDLSLEIKAGEYVGIVGTSGCGKSTLLKMLLGFETPQSGIIMLDGKDLRSIDKSAYRKQLGVVLQNGKLISGSIYENITITNPHVSMQRVNEVIDQVGLREDIEQMPMGIHTVLSENSSTISGGQQQRILIARAIVGSPKILIFDEATSALDNLTQAAVSENLDRMNVTRIIVAHRLSTIKNCDRILVLNEGTIAEEGTYESLMNARGLFYALASRQIAE